MAAMDVIPPPVETSTTPANGLPHAVPPNNLGRDKLIEWSPAVWERIDRAVRTELARACVTTKFLPVVPTPSPSERTVAADTIATDANGALAIDQSRVLPLLEESQPFVLSKEQYHDEERIGTGCTLASRAANRLAQAMDRAILTGGVNPNLVDEAERHFVVDVPPLENADRTWGENTFRAVSTAYAQLQGAGQYGPYALVLPTEPFADAHAPLPTTLIMPADRIRPLMTAGFHGTGALPERQGVMISIGGNTADVAVGVGGVTAFTLIDDDETYRFRVYERSTVRVKDRTALVLLRFL